MCRKGQWRKHYCLVEFLTGREFCGYIRTFSCNPLGILLDHFESGYLVSHFFECPFFFFSWIYLSTFFVVHGRLACWFLINLFFYCIPIIFDRHPVVCYFTYNFIYICNLLNLCIPFVHSVVLLCELHTHPLTTYLYPIIVFYCSWIYFHFIPAPLWLITRLGEFTILIGSINTYISRDTRNRDGVDCIATISLIYPVRCHMQL